MRIRILISDNMVNYNKISTENLKNLTDEDLILLYRNGNTDAADYIIQNYKGVVKRKARTMFLAGGETDDLIQEGMIGLYKAIRDFDAEKDTSFATFAGICMDRQMYTAIDASRRKKHSPLNTYVSINAEKNNGDEIKLNSDNTKNPEEIYIDKENVAYIERLLKEKLSNFEYRVITLYIEGMGYREIAENTGKKPKSIDNALQRIKSKIINALS